MGDEHSEDRLQVWRRDLQSYKSDVNLVEFAVERYGYQIRRKESYRRVKVLKNEATNHKIIVARDARDGHWIYFSIESQELADKARRGLDRRGDNGTIVDFIRHREKNAGMREVHAECRKWLGRPAQQHAADRPDYHVEPSAPSEHDCAKVALQFSEAKLVERSPYLEQRGIRPETLNSERFAASWRVDWRGNVLFPHRDAEGVTGFEIKNAGFTGFASGGVKRLWHSRAATDDRALVIAETAIDALSYHQLHPNSNARYMATAGMPNAEQLQLLKRSVQKMPSSSRVVLAVDNDEGGDKLAAVLQPVATQSHVTLERHSPPQRGEDWNDVLRHRERSYIESLPLASDVRPPSRKPGLER